MDSLHDPTPVNAMARSSAYGLLWKFMSGEITSDELAEGSWPHKSDDFLLKAAADQLWFLYDDRLPQRYPDLKLSADQEDMIRRLVTFFGSSLPYRWPGLNLMAIHSGWISILPLLGRRAATRADKQMRDAGG